MILIMAVIHKMVEITEISITVYLKFNFLDSLISKKIIN